MCAEGGDGGTTGGVWSWVQAVVCCQAERYFVCREGLVRHFSANDWTSESREFSGHN